MSVLALSLGGCGVNPVTGQSELQLVSTQSELAMGAKNYAPLQQSQGGQYKVDPGLSVYVNQVGQRLAAVSDRKLPYEFVVINNSIPNAWALPGGKIAINRGLLIELTNEAELAAVLGHEVVHAAARHSAQKIEKGMTLNIGLILLGAAVGSEKNGEALMATGSVGAALLSQKYSRDAESESDHFGMNYMVRAGYDPYAAVSLQETFVRLSKGKEPNWLEGLFASHPPSQQRVDANRLLAKKLNRPGLVKNEKEFHENFYNPKNQSKVLYGITKVLDDIQPKIWKPAEEFAIEKSRQTFGNVAWEAYKKYGTKAPIINIENPPAGFGLSRAKDVKEMVKGSREQFVENAVKNGMSESQAKKEAEKLIGATWDVGHINQLRQFGFSSEDIIKEAEEIAPYVKHVHLSDNFGMENTELPMGMGNVDLKEVMKKLGKKGEDAKKIIEAAHWSIHQQTLPVSVSYEALGSPIYGMDMAPYWNQSPGFSQSYSSGYGMMLPQINYETFGAGFSQLPAELGGQRPGRSGGRMSGTPME